MFEYLLPFAPIVVTGPQRSGTRIISKMIAYDIGYKFVDERDIGNDRMDLLEKYLRIGKVVVQCPAMMNRITELRFPNILIAVVQRQIKDIVASEKRIGWDGVLKEKELKKYGYTSGVISSIKYKYFNDVQKAILTKQSMAYTEIRYDIIKDHPLFIPTEKRIGFAWDQTEVQEEL